jgi:hypothetical protein
MANDKKQRLGAQLTGGNQDDQPAIGGKKKGGLGAQLKSGGEKQAPAKKLSGTLGESLGVEAMDEEATAELAAKLDQLKQTLDGLTARLELPELAEAVESLTDDMKQLPEKIQGIRDRGYVFQADLESKAEEMAQQQQAIEQQYQAVVDEQIPSLRETVAQAQQQFADLENHTALAQQKQVPGIETLLTEAAAKLDAAEAPITELQDTLNTAISQANSQLYQINWIMEQKEEASFDFQANEAVFLAAKAEWVVTGKGKKDPDGILYLTDQRLIFEQKEKTGKKLGMFGGKEEQEVEWEAPISAVESVETENKGMLGGKDMLELTMGAESRYPNITLEVKGGADNKFWAEQIQRAVSGDINSERIS